MPGRTFTDVLELMAGKAEESIAQGIEMAELRGFLEAHRETLDALPEEALLKLFDLAASHISPDGRADVVVTAEEINVALTDNADALAAMQERRERLRRLVLDMVQLASRATIQLVLGLLAAA